MDKPRRKAGREKSTYALKQKPMNLLGENEIDGVAANRNYVLSEGYQKGKTT